MKKWKNALTSVMILAAMVCFVSGCWRQQDRNNTKTGNEKEFSDSPSPAQSGKHKEHTAYSFRTWKKKFQVCEKDGKWKDLTPIGVNIGAGKPGAFPGDFAITKNDYMRWFQQISEMHANVIRVYTILMPEFYEALAEFNAAALEPLYFMQGVYNNEEDISNLCDAYAEDGKIAKDWVSLCRTIVDVVHGNAELEAEAGQAGGLYTADVSEYLCGWILGIEWETEFVVNTNKNNSQKKYFEGKYLYTEQASPFEVFLAEGLDACISYEAEQYNMQHPAAFANWVTTDPLDHPGEPNREMEDAVSVDAEHIKAKPEMKAGLFASYHVYPYYPEMMRYAPELMTENPPNPYKHYLTDLNDYHTVPVLISEFGVPESRGITHFAKDKGFNQGGLNEQQQGEAIVSMLEDILQSGCAGGYVFIWQDEWFKRAWNTMDFTDPEIRPYWCDVQTSEEFFGLLSFDPGEKPVCIVDGDASDWEGEQPLLASKDTELYVKSDEAYIYLMLRGKNDDIRITADTVKGQGNAEYNGADFAIDIKGENESRVMVHPYYDVNYWLYTTGLYASGSVLKEQEGYADPQNDTFAPIYLMLNRPVLLSDGTLVETEQIETGRLHHGNADPDAEEYDSRADFYIKDNVTEVRLPWLLLNISKPNVKMCIADLYAHNEITYQAISEITFMIDGAAASYYWEEWNKPAYRERLKKSYYILQDYLSKR